MEKVLQTINMCDYCTHGRTSCGAGPVLSREVSLNNGIKQDSQEAVVACDKYESPVESLTTRFY